MSSRRSFLGGLTLLAGVGACSRPESLDSYLSDALPDGASLTVLAARDREIVLGRGYGLADRTRRIPAGLDVAYDICSITKQFTAAAVLSLEVAGRLSVRDRVSEFFRGVPSGRRAITLHHLLTHTAGLVDALGDDYAALSRDDLLAGAARTRLRSRPGSAYHYSNLGYSLLAAVVERVSGRSYEAYLRRHLFAPAGMTRTGYVLPRWDRVAVEYDRAGRSQGRPMDHPWDDDGPYWNLRGNGGLLSTARDMFRWHLALRDGKVLPESSVARLFRPYVEEDGGETHYGYGWVVEDDGRVWHDGGNDRSYGVLSRSADARTMVFWITNEVERAGRWNLSDLDLTGEIESRLPT